MIRGAYTMLQGAGRANAYEEMATGALKLYYERKTAHEIGRYMAAYVRDVMQEEIDA